MNIETIPLRSDIFFYTFKINLSGTIYSFKIRYNGRMDRWILNIEDAIGNEILSGIVLLINRDIVSQYTTLNLMPGLLSAVDTSPNMVQPTQFSFGNNNFLVYLS